MADTKIYTAAMADQILEAMASGQSLRQVCNGPGMPDESTVRKWALRDVDGFAAKFRTAQELGVDARMDEIADMATSLPRRLGAETHPLLVQAERLAWDSARWHAGKCHPKKWGDKVALEHSGEIATGSLAEALRERRKLREEQEKK